MATDTTRFRERPGIGNHMKSLVRPLVLLGCAIALHSYAPRVQAAFSCQTPLQLVSSPGSSDIKVDPSAADGTIVGTVIINAPANPGFTAANNCYGSWPYPQRVRFEGTRSVVGTRGGGNLYDTGIPGLAYQVHFGPRFCDGGQPWPRECQFLGRDSQLAAHSFYFELVKTGPISEQGTITGLVAQAYETNAGFIWQQYQLVAPIAVIPTKPSCAVSIPDVVVNLDAVNTSDFPGVNDVAKEQDFKISLVCSGGDVGTTTTVNMSLADQTAPGNVSTTLSPTAESTASGVALQITRNGTPISLDPAVNKFKVQDVLPGNSTIDVPFKARYVRTSGAVTAGAVQGIAVYTLEYL